MYPSFFQLCLLMILCLSIMTESTTTTSSPTAWLSDLFSAEKITIPGVPQSVSSILRPPPRYSPIVKDVAEFGREMRILCEEIVNMTHRISPSSIHYEKTISYCRNTFGFTVIKDENTGKWDGYWIIEDRQSAHTMYSYIQMLQETYMGAWKENPSLVYRCLYERFTYLSRILSKLSELTARQRHRMHDKKKLFPVSLEGNDNIGGLRDDAPMFLMSREDLEFEWNMLLSDMHWLQRHLFPESRRLSSYTENVQQEWSTHTATDLRLSAERWQDWSRHLLQEYLIPVKMVGGEVLRLPREWMQYMVQSSLRYLFALWMAIICLRLFLRRMLKFMVYKRLEH
jgi:hypothetical protein